MENYPLSKMFKKGEDFTNHVSLELKEIDGELFTVISGEGFPENAIFESTSRLENGDTIFNYYIKRKTPINRNHFEAGILDKNQPNE